MIHAAPKPRKKAKTRRSRPKAVNAARKRREFLRAYGSKERVEFVKWLPCVTCHFVPSENAHIETGGTGRKADYTKIVPLCGAHAFPSGHPWRYGGCHGLLHLEGRIAFEVRHGVSLGSLAAYTELAWQSFQQHTEGK